MTNVLKTSLVRFFWDTFQLGKIKVFKIRLKLQFFMLPISSQNNKKKQWLFPKKTAQRALPFKIILQASKTHETLSFILHAYHTVR